MNAPSAWVVRFAALLRPGAQVLDLACGSGRHVRWLANAGHQLTAIDRDAAAIAPLAEVAQTMVADLENQPWPLAGRCFDGIIVTNYLWRPLLPLLATALAPGGVLIYETFALGQASIGRPSRPEFLLQPGELLRTCQGLHVVAYEDGFEPQPERFVQRVAAVKPDPLAPAPSRYALAAL